MAKFFGEIGYANTEETVPGVWVENYIERPYYGDILRNNRRLQNQGRVNDDISISNQISIIADPFAYENFHSMRYINFMNNKWRIIDVEVQRPRLILTLGGLFNGQEN